MGHFCKLSTEPWMGLKEGVVPLGTQGTGVYSEVYLRVVLGAGITSIALMWHASVVPTGRHLGCPQRGSSEGTDKSHSASGAKLCNATVRSAHPESFIPVLPAWLPSFLSWDKLATTSSPPHRDQRKQCPQRSLKTMLCDNPLAILLPPSGTTLLGSFPASLGLPHFQKRGSLFVEPISHYHGNKQRCGC